MNNYITVKEEVLKTALISAFEQGRETGVLIKDGFPVDVKKRAKALAEVIVKNIEKYD